MIKSHGNNSNGGVPGFSCCTSAAGGTAVSDQSPRYEEESQD